MEGMSGFPDNHFDLAIVDPPYGILNKTKRGVSKYIDGKKYEKWDNKPSDSFFYELKRVAKCMIVWGGNYFSILWTFCKYNQGFIIWDKSPTMPTYSDTELAWSNNEAPNKIFKYHNNNEKEKRIHPTQKPVALYKFLLKNYAKEGDLILDTHVGSGSSLIACEDMGFEYVGYELDADYYKAASERLARHKEQIRMF